MTLQIEHATPQRPARRSHPGPWITALVIASVLVTTVGGIALGHHDGGSSTAPATGSTRADAVAQALARGFLSSWVDPDGRVVRRDQGNDTVSEGQGYGMLLALVAEDRRAFTSIWTWTSSHLQQQDGALAWRWQDGRVVDGQPASDADLDVARALGLAARTWPADAATWHAAADRIASATLAHSTVAAPPGRVLVGGPWAVGSSGHPAQIAPGYLVAGEARQLAHDTGANAWTAVAAGTAALDRELIGSGRLTPDWTTLAPGSAAGSARPAPAPDGSEGIAYGLDAPRLLIRLAASCDAGDRALAARAPAATTVLGADGIRQLDGTPLVSWTHPLTDVAVAAVRSAQGDVSARDHALDAAGAEQRATPTYYGAAWVALGTALLTTRLLDSCAGGTS